jgi:hypothetical protein
VDEQIPAWAIELIKQVERLNEKLPTHVEWVEKTLYDQEKRIRTLEQFRWMLLGVASISGVLGALISRYL